MIDYNNFYDELWGQVHASIINEEFINNNREFVDTVTFDLYRMYEMEGNISINFIRRLLVTFLHYHKIFKVRYE